MPTGQTPCMEGSGRGRVGKRHLGSKGHSAPPLLLVLSVLMLLSLLAFLWMMRTMEQDGSANTAFLSPSHSSHPLPTAEKSPPSPPPLGLCPFPDPVSRFLLSGEEPQSFIPQKDGSQRELTHTPLPPACLPRSLPQGAASQRPGQDWDWPSMCQDMADRDWPTQ